MLIQILKPFSHWSDRLYRCRVLSSHSINGVQCFLPVLFQADWLKIKQEDNYSPIQWNVPAFMQLSLVSWLLTGFDKTYQWQQCITKWIFVWLPLAYCRSMESVIGMSSIWILDKSDDLVNIDITSWVHITVVWPFLMYLLLSYLPCYLL